MKHPLALAAIAAVAICASSASATDSAETDLSPVSMWEQDKSLILDARDITLEDFLWIARPIVVFADTPADPAFQRQMELLKDRPIELIDRDVVVITDTDPSAKTDLRRKLRPRGFMLTLIDKDGGIKLRKPFPWDIREISRSIDKMPIRKQELKERREVQ